MNELDKTEYSRLETQVAEVERILDGGHAGVGANGLLGEFLRNARARMNEIRPDGVLSERNRKEDSRIDQLAVAAMVERETRLTTAEKEQYGGFLKLDFFTKEHFDELEEFYSGAWDRLSEEGKAQMSHRIWEGVRRGEYRFEELPETVRKKEADHLYEQLVDVSQIHGSLANIPKQDREDFIRAHEAGDKKAEAEILSRESFAMNVSTTSSTEDSLRESSVSSKKEAEDQNPVSHDSRESNDPSDELSLAGVALADVADVSSPTIQNPVSRTPVERG